MKKSLLFFFSIIMLIGAYGITPYVFAQTSNEGVSPIIPPPSGGGETVAIPPIENMELAPLTGQTTPAGETPSPIQPLQPAPSVEPLTGTTPAITEQPIAPVPAGSVAGIPLSAPAGQVETSPALQPLPPLEQQPAAEFSPSTVPLSIGPGQTQPSGLQPSAEMPALPLTTQTTEMPAPAVTPTTSPLTPAPAVTPLPPTGVTPAPVTSSPSVQPSEVNVQPQLPSQTAPVKLITKPPHIVPGEVLSSMPAYVNTETTHIVKPGEDLHWLAAIYYGDARLWYKIYDANKKTIKNPNQLVVGTKLIIPPK